MGGKTFTAASGEEKFDMTTKQTVENVHFWRMWGR